MGSTTSSSYSFNQHRAPCNNVISVASEPLSSPLPISEYDSTHPEVESIDTCIRYPACQFKPNSLTADIFTRQPDASSTQWKIITEASLDSLLMYREGYELVIHLQGQSAVCAADSIDNILESGQLTDIQRRKYTAALRKLCGNCGILPTSHTITDGLNKVGELPIAGGGFAEVWEGDHRGRKVATKALKVYSSSDRAKVKNRFCKEAIIWKRLSHPNILPFIGVATSPFKFGMVSPWMVHGDIIVYLKSHPQANPICILEDIIDGLAYLHSKNIIHGDIKGANILMNENERACLADFGLTTIICDAIPGYSITTANSWTARWTAPELFNPELCGLTKSVHSKECDIYAFGMVTYEVITGTVPFSQYGSIVVGPKVIAGIRPERPSDATTASLVDAIWPIAEQCWHQDRDQRPSTGQIRDQLDVAISLWTPSESFLVAATLDESDGPPDASSNSGYSLRVPLPTH